MGDGWEGVLGVHQAAAEVPWNGRTGRCRPRRSGGLPGKSRVGVISPTGRVFCLALFYRNPDLPESSARKQELLSSPSPPNQTDIRKRQGLGGVSCGGVDFGFRWWGVGFHRHPCVGIMGGNAIKPQWVVVGVYA